MLRAWPFKLNVIEHSTKKSAGENRNVACAAAKGDVLICQDADDLPHPQRVEIIKHIFQNYCVDLLMHQYTRKQFTQYDLRNLILKRCPTFKDMRTGDGFTQGNVAITKELSKKVQWPTHFEIAEDMQFNKEVCKTFSNIITVRAELLLYRQELSSWKTVQILRERLRKEQG